MPAHSPRAQHAVRVLAIASPKRCSDVITAKIFRERRSAKAPAAPRGVGRAVPRHAALGTPLAAPQASARALKRLRATKFLPHALRLRPRAGPRSQAAGIRAVAACLRWHDRRGRPHGCWRWHLRSGRCLPQSNGGCRMTQPINVFWGRGDVAKALHRECLEIIARK